MEGWSPITGGLIEVSRTAQMSEYCMKTWPFMGAIFAPTYTKRPVGVIAPLQKPTELLLHQRTARSSRSPDE